MRQNRKYTKACGKVGHYVFTHSYATDAKKKRREPQTKYRIGMVSNKLLGCVRLTGLTGTKLAVSSVVAHYKLRNPRRFLVSRRFLLCLCLNL